MRKVVITGGTGFIGLSLAKQLSERSYEVIVIGRSKPKKNLDFEYISWDAVNLGKWVNALEGATAIVNLAGRTVDCIKSPENCDVILRSRVDSTKIIGKALEEVQNPPKVWVQMSTAHIYGDPPSQLCTESSSTGYGLAPFVGTAWEKAFKESLPEGIRGVRLRTSFVVGKNGGALNSLRNIARLGLGGSVGSGKQGISWIHEFDMNAIIIESIENENFKDFYIASAPNPVSNREFMKTLRGAMRMPVGLPSPAWLTAIGARYLFRTDPELALYGRYVKSERLEKEGFQFKFPELKQALNDLIRKK